MIKEKKIEKINLLIVEDHALMRFGLKNCFKKCDFIKNIYEAADGKTAIKLAKNEDISVILMDLGLPDIDGINATKLIKDENPNMKIIILTSHNDNDEVISAINAGANAYCSKEIKQNRLIEVINTVKEGGAWFDPKVANFVLEATKRETNKQEKEEILKVNLTKREKQVLQLIKRGMSNNEISIELKISVNTIKAHVSSLLQKLESEDRVRLALKAMKYKII